MGRGTLWWDARDYSRAMRAYMGIEAHNLDPVIEQIHYAWGDPGTETGHSLDTADTARSIEQDGLGNYTAFLRVELEQSRTTADQNLTVQYQVQFQINTGGYGAIGAATTGVRTINDTNITGGAATTNRISGSSAAFLAGLYDESTGIFDPLTWAGSSTEHTELLISLEFVDADLSDGDVIEFRIVENGGTVIDTYTVTPTLNWNAPASFVGVDEGDLVRSAPVREPNVTVFS